MILEKWLGKFFPKGRPNCPKLIFRPQNPNVRALGSEKFFMSSSIKLCIKQALFFKFWVISDKVMSVSSKKNVKKPFKNLLVGAISDM